ncbi:MAG: hypothetical protein ACREDT_11140 [Methylocella sp.]
MADRKQTIKIGIAGAVAILAAISAVWIALPLLVIVVLLFAWGLEPKRTEEFIGRVPAGKYVLTALAKLDSIISSWS